MMQPSANAIPEAAGLAVLIARLQSAGVDWDGENVADLLWLANYIDPPASNDDFNSAPEEERDSVRIEINDSAPAPLPEMSPTLALSMPQPSRVEKAAASKPRRGIPFQTPTAPALRNRLEIGRSLRPLMRKVDSYTRQVLDESATAELTAQQQFCIPVMRPERERWLELALVIEDSASSFLWREVIRDFRQVLERQGAFRTVTTWYLQTTATNDIHLLAQRPQRGVTPRSRSPKELLESSGRRLVFFISDCISPAWQQGRLQEKYLALWAKHGPVAIVQMLPARLWHRTALAEGDRVPFFARSPGVPNAQLLSPALSEDTTVDLGLKLPIITVEPASMAHWARLLAGSGDASAAGVWFESDWQAQVEVSESVMASPAAELAETTPASSEDVAAAAAQLLSRFSTTASDTARELAALMTLVPVDLSLVYIIQTKLLSDSTPLHVAEVFLSGLVERVKDNDAETDLEPETGGSFFATRRRYDFVPGVRDILTDIVEIPSAERVLNEISVYICARLNRSSRNFTALLRLGDELDAEGEEFAEFARVTKQALRRLGGEYAALVDDIEQPAVPEADGVGRLVSFPPLEMLNFEKGELIDDKSLDDEVEPSTIAFPPPLKTATFQIATVSLPQHGLEVFEFKTAKIERERAGLFRRLQWVVKKNRAQARRFIEPLGDDLSLEMVAISGGTFIMGSSSSESKRRSSEGPQHEVGVPSFFIGRYPVTQSQWQFVANLPQVTRKLKLNPSYFKGDNLPVERISWHESVEFCDRLCAYTDHTYRLPTEAEWEYACRARTTTPFHYGNMILSKVANYDGNFTYSDGSMDESRGRTTPINEFDVANAFGLSDMHGNVLEWCQDRWHKNYEEAPMDGSAWLAVSQPSRCILRGGSWADGSWDCRSAYRDVAKSSSRFDRVGFRVCCSASRT